MACGPPVDVSDRSSLPEVVADAGIAVPPDDPEAWRKALERVIEDTDFAAGMRHRGILRAAQFSWARAARQTWRAGDDPITQGGLSPRRRHTSRLLQATRGGAILLELHQPRRGATYDPRRRHLMSSTSL